MTESAARTLPGIRWWHRWISIVIGILIFGWIASGMLMMLPPTAMARTGQGTGAPIGWQQESVSPAQAIRAAQAAIGSNPPPAASQVTLQRLRDGMIYVVRLDGHRTVLIDAATAAPLTISAEVAVRIAADAVSDTGTPGVERVTRAPAYYYGPLPAWHVTFSDRKRTEAFVSQVTGEVARFQARDRLLEVVGHSIHVFTPLARLPGGTLTRKGTLEITGLIALISVLTGYWLSLPRRWRGPA
ncbi:MAG TPA: PepSY domain-containing protein [Gemmatimonadales bacterium]|jgi:uncharacterized iron-regulated membrane protein